MEVKLNLFATLKRFIPDEVKGSSWNISISEGTKVRELLEQLKIPTDAVKLMFLNGIHSNGNEILKDGDRVGVFPPIGGG
jgi:molybdopterin synthase sulfur carrier subunit